MGRMPVKDVNLLTESDNRRRLMIERNCLDTSDSEFNIYNERESKLFSSLRMNLKINPQHSSGKCEETACCDDLVEVFFMFIVDVKLGF